MIIYINTFANPLRMEKLANCIWISVFAKEEENAAEIEKFLKELVGLDIEKEKIKFSCKTAIGFHERKIKIMEIVLEKNRHINEFLKNLASKFNQEQKELLARQAESRLDDDFNFFLRLDKEKLLCKECWITDTGNCYHLKMSIACFPKKRENALAVIKQIFK